jgi:hypothetical protein
MYIKVRGCARRSYGQTLLAISLIVALTETAKAPSLDVPASVLAGGQVIQRRGTADRDPILLLLHKYGILYNSMRRVNPITKTANRRRVRAQGNPRRNAVLESVKKAGLLEGARARIAGRIRKQLVRAAKTRSGIKSDTDLLEYALARVALEDDFGQKLIAREGRVPQDIQLEF